MKLKAVKRLRELNINQGTTTTSRKKKELIEEEKNFNVEDCFNEKQKGTKKKGEDR